MLFFLIIWYCTLVKTRTIPQHFCPMIIQINIQLQLADCHFCYTVLDCRDDDKNVLKWQFLNILNNIFCLNFLSFSGWLFHKGNTLIAKKAFHLVRGIQFEMNRLLHCKTEYHAKINVWNGTNCIINIIIFIKERAQAFLRLSVHIYICVYNLIMHYNLFDQHKFIRTFRISY